MKDDHTISWNIQPHKKSINFGIFKHPGSGFAPLPKQPSSSFEAPPTPGLRSADGVTNGQPPPVHSSSAIEKLEGIGFKLVLWHGTCEANQVTSGKYDVPKEEGGMYALVFDNTFAKSFSKTATFVLLTYPTDSAPLSNHQVHHIQGAAAGSSSSLRAKGRPTLLPGHRKSSDEVLPTSVSVNGTNKTIDLSRQRRVSMVDSSDSEFFTGVLQKRRRKKHQGYGRRFFSLNFTTSTLSYYHDRNTLSLRGAIPLSLAAIGANATTREISIDSGAEVWHLKALNKKDFEAWKSALETAAKASKNNVTSPGRLDNANRYRSLPPANPEEEQEWAKAEDLVSRVALSRDVARRLAKDTDPKYLSLGISSPKLAGSMDSGRSHDLSSTEASPSENAAGEEYFQGNIERRPFWRRKPSGAKQHQSVFRRSVSAQAVAPAPTNIPHQRDRASSTVPKHALLQSFPEENLHEQCMTLLQDLDVIVAEFSALIAESKSRRMPHSSLPPSRRSIDSEGSEEFFDAEGGDASQVLTIHPETDDEASPTDHDSNIDEHENFSSESEDHASFATQSIAGNSSMPCFPGKPKSLIPLPLPPIKRRTTVPTPTVSPPSLIGFLRKNVGKDLSTISMPVSANEPISLLQRVSEQLEYSSLLDEAAKDSHSSFERLLYMTAFSISSLSALRVKERALRKPFNPMLGETFELVREDKGFRFIGEKISHRPVKLACQAESEKWSLSQTPAPTQKFWGKSAELITEGRVRVVLHSTGDRFSWTNATCFLRNIIAGEKYVEPVGTMTVTNEVSGDYAVVTFKTKGMFSGRSDEVTAQVFDFAGDETPLGLSGKWTQSLTVVENGSPHPQPLWTVGTLVPDATKTYGFTTFTAALNDISSLERDKLPPTDSRFRPDQRAAEEGEIELAETLKAKLEEKQRERRKALEEEEGPGAEWQPMWFSKVEGVEGEEVYRLKGGKESYWEHRAKGDWKGVRDVLAV